MPVRKLKTIAESEDSLLLDPEAPDFWARIAALWELSDRLFERSFPPGVHKHRTMEGLNRCRESWEEESIEQGKARVATGSSA